MKDLKLSFLALSYKGHPEGRLAALRDANTILGELTRKFSQNNLFICLFMHDGQFLDDALDSDRAIGVERSLNLLKKSEEIWIREADLTLTSGISPHSALFDELEQAKGWRKRVILFQTDPIRILKSPTMRVEGALAKVFKLRYKKD